MKTRRDFLRQSVYWSAGIPLLLMGCESKNTPAAGEAEDSPTASSAAQKQPPAMSAVPYLETIGLQLWTVREQLAADPVTTLTALKEMGYQQVELMDTRQAEQLLPICRDLGLAVNSSFMLWTTLTNRWDLVPQESQKMEFAEVLDQANAAGLSHLVFGYLTPGERETLDDYRRWADVLNEAGLKAKERGLKMAYHNHNFEFAKLDDGVPFEVLIERLDPDAFTFELDVFWAALGGYDPVQLLTRIKDRTSLVHLKDLKSGAQQMDDVMDVPEDFFEELGDGILPIQTLATMARQFGVDYCFVEQDFSPDPLKSVARSLDFII